MATCPSPAATCPPCALPRSWPQPSPRCNASMGFLSLVCLMKKPRRESLQGALPRAHWRLPAFWLVPERVWQVEFPESSDLDKRWQMVWSSMLVRTGWEQPPDTSCCGSSGGECGWSASSMRLISDVCHRHRNGEGEQHVPWMGHLKRPQLCSESGGVMGLKAASLSTH